MRSVFAPRCKAQIEVVLDGRGAPNSRPLYIEVDPHESTVGVNGFYEADTFSMEFDAKTFPFDPDQVAYIAVRIYMWDARAGTTDVEWAIPDNELIRGLVDDIDSSLVTSDGIVKLTGRDYTALLLDPKWDPKVSVPAGRPLDETVQAIADAAAPKGTRARFTVVWDGVEPTAPIVGSLQRTTHKKGLWFKKNSSYWDVIWDLCIQHAYVPRVVGSTIYIGEPKTETKRTLAVAPTLVYGQTLTKLEIKRKFAHEKVPQIVLTAWDPTTGKKIEVAYPKKRNIDVLANADPSATDALGIPLTVKKDEVLYFPAPKGVVDPKALLRYARMRFYHLGRGETVYSIETNSLIIDGPTEGSEYNLLRHRPGDPIGVRFDPFNQAYLRAIDDVGQRIEYILAHGYSEQVAVFVANNVDRLDLFKQSYYYNRGQIHYSTDDASSIEIEAVNFASEVREINFANASDDEAPAL